MSVVTDITDLTVEQLAEAWQRIRDTSPADEADPFVLDCARRLSADPGGEQAHVWVSGLLAMSGHLARRPVREAERAALDALRAAVKELGRRACSHEDHPYESEMDWIEDEIWLGDNGLLTGELPGQDADVDSRQGAVPGQRGGLGAPRRGRDRAAHRPPDPRGRAAWTTRVPSAPCRGS